MIKLFAIAAIVSLCATGCRSVENTTHITNYGDRNSIESLSEGTQAADKEVGDISPSTSATVTPGL